MANVSDLWLRDVSRETKEKLIVYADLLIRWQKIQNLVSPHTLQDIWVRHFQDSAQIFAFGRHLKVWADLGAGAGFPGLVVALLMPTSEGGHVHLIESNQRKCAFLREVARRTDAPVSIHNDDLTVVLPKLTGIDVLTSRALAPLDELVEMCLPYLKPNVLGIFPRGQGHANELTRTLRYETVKIELVVSETDANSRIALVRALD